jgi:tetrahydromethanopterin S-methyltransferase subunit E
VDVKKGLRFWFYAESILGTLTGILFIVTLFSRDWIETIFHIDPDQGQGWVEWLIVVALALVTVGLGALARAEWSRPSIKAA